MKHLFLLCALTGTSLAQGPLTPPPGADPGIGPVNALTAGGLPQATMKTLHQVEPRTAIPGGTSTVTLNQSGSYYLTGNLILASGHGILIEADGVTLDLNGFTIATSETPAVSYAVAIGYNKKNISVLNGHIQGVAAGAFLNGVGGYNGMGLPRNVRVTGMNISNCTVHGVALDQGLNNVVEGCIVDGAAIQSSMVKNSAVSGASILSPLIVGSTITTAGTTRPVDTLVDAQNRNQNLALYLSGDLGWITSTVDATGVASRSPSLAVGPDFNPAMAYFDFSGKNLMFASQNGLSWTVTTVASDGNVGEYPSLAFGPDGQPCIAYLDATNFDLKFVRFDGSAWIESTVDSNGLVGWFPSLRFAPDGRPAISYLDVTSGTLKYAHFSGATWSITSVGAMTTPGNSSFPGTSLAFGPDGQPAIAFFDDINDDLRYARFNGTTWVLNAVEQAGEVGVSPSLVFGSEAQPHIAYIAHGSFDLKFARLDGAVWSLQTVDSAGTISEPPSLAFGPDGQPAIAYGDAVVSGVKVARFKGASWNISTVSTAVSLPSCSMIFDRKGLPSVCFNDFTTGQLRFARMSAEP
jgi:hypothetical protein